MKTHENSIIFFFDKGMGGIGDYLKFFIVAYDFSIFNNLNFYYINKNLIENYIIFKYNESKILEYDENETLIVSHINILTQEFIKNSNKKYFLLKPQTMYNYNHDVYEICNKYILKDYFIFSNEIIDYCKNNIDLKNYTSIHLRLGDAYLETDKNFIQCPNDKRYYNENKLFKFINDNINDKIYFFCDNEKFKNKIKNKFQNINILNLKIGHTSLENTTHEQIFNTIVEFYIMTNSQSINIFSLSGFPILASRFNDVKLIKHF